MSPLRRLALVSYVTLCALLGAGRSLAQTECAQTTPAGVAGHAAPEEARPVGAGAAPMLYMMRRPAMADAAAKAKVRVVCVPDFTNMTLDQAKAAIERSKELLFLSATPADGGTVMDQNPKPFRYVVAGTGVTLQLQPPKSVSHLRQVPDITRMDESRVEIELRRAGLKYGGSSTSETNEYAPGFVFQDPPAGRWVEENTPVFRYQATAPQEPPPTSQLSLRASATDLSINELVGFEAALTPPLEGVRYQFDFGDHQQGDLRAENMAQHQYEKDDTFTVTVTAQLPTGETLQATTTVRVHAIAYTVVVTPDPSRAETNTPIVFELSLLPASPPPERPEYLFYFDSSKEAVPSSVPRLQRSFADTRPFLSSDSRAHRVRVFVRDADGHIFTSDVVGFVIVARPIWPWAASSVAVVAFLGLGGLRIARRTVTKRLKYKWVARTSSAPRTAGLPERVLETGLEFRVIRPPLNASAQCNQPIITNAKRLI